MFVHVRACVCGLVCMRARARVCAWSACLCVLGGRKGSHHFCALVRVCAREFRVYADLRRDDRAALECSISEESEDGIRGSVMMWCLLLVCSALVVAQEIRATYFVVSGKA